MTSKIDDLNPENNPRWIAEQLWQRLVAERDHKGTPLPRPSDFSGSTDTVLGVPLSVMRIVNGQVMRMSAAQERRVVTRGRSIHSDAPEMRLRVNVGGEAEASGGIYARFFKEGSAASMICTELLCLMQWHMDRYEVSGGGAYAQSSVPELVDNR